MPRDDSARQSDARGQVTVVGAGPGLHDLVTVRGRRWLRDAQVVFYDPAVSAALLAEAPEGVDCVCLRAPASQLGLVLERARAGGLRVVILVPGAGSAGESRPLARELEASGCVWRFVPGVGLPAFASPGPLDGRQVIVTRAWPQAAQACRQLEARGAVALSMPTIAIGPAPEPKRVAETIARVERYNRLILTSANAVDPLKGALSAAGLDARALAGIQLCAVGPATAKALAKIGLRADLVARDYRAEGLLEQLTPDVVQGERILLLRAQEAREVLPDTLRERGATVDVVAAYVTTVAPRSAWTAGLSALRAREVDAVTFTSASTARHFCQIVGDELAALLAEVVVAAIGPVTAEACEALGLKPKVVAERYTVDALVDALAQHFAAES